MMRRALLEAERYASWRKVLGRPIAEFAHVEATLAGMRARWAGCALSFFEELALIEKEDAAAEVLIPLLKFQISKRATEQVREAQLIFAGNGIGNGPSFEAPLTLTVQANGVIAVGDAGLERVLLVDPVSGDRTVP